MNHQTAALLRGLLGLTLLVAIPACNDDHSPATFRTTLEIVDAAGASTDTFAPGEPVTFKMTVQNLTGEPRTLTFSSAAQEGFVVLDSSPDALWDRIGGGITLAVTHQHFLALESKVFTMTWTQVDDVGNPLGAGVYDAQGYLFTLSEPAKRTAGDYTSSEVRSSSVPFTIQ